MQQSSATQSLHLSFWGLRKIVACSHSSLQCLLVSTVFGTVSSLHPTSFLMIFILVIFKADLTHPHSLSLPLLPPSSLPFSLTHFPLFLPLSFCLPPISLSLPPSPLLLSYLPLPPPQTLHGQNGVVGVTAVGHVRVAPGTVGGSVRMATTALGQMFWWSTAIHTCLVMEVSALSHLKADYRDNTWLTKDLPFVNYSLTAILMNV